MNTRAEKSQENKSQSVANEISQKHESGEHSFELVDNRPEAIAQRKLRETVNNSSQANQLMALQQMINDSPQAKKARQAQEKADNYIAKQYPTQKKENSNGLPEHLKSGLKNLSGFAMDDVKVHYNSNKPAQLQALAYAQGTNIHIAPGQEKHLPHEAWHVVQQKQGRVKPTLQMKGQIGINNNTALEREADTMGDKAMNLNVSLSDHSEVLQQKVTSGSMTHTQSDVVQRKVGFEFESVGDNKWRFQGRNNDYEEWKGISNTKDVLLKSPSGLAGAGADSGNVEFITAPLSNWAEVTTAFQEMAGLVARLKTGDGTGKTVLNGADNAYAKSLTGFEQHRIDSHGNDIIARPQATFGVSIMKIPDLFDALINMNQGKTATGDAPGLTSDKAVGSNTTAYAVQVSAQAAEQIMIKACEYDGFSAQELLELERKEIIGFLSIVFKTLWDAYSNSGAELTDPKYALPLMPRTDFVSMLNTLEPDTIELIKRLWNDGPLVRAISEVYPLNSVVFPGGYTGTDKKRHKGPMKRAWIDSIINAKGPKDLLSPPEGFPQHADTPRPEGIGAYGADEDYLALFELRDLGSGGNLPIGDWINIATSVSKMVAVVMEDEGLAPV